MKVFCHIVLIITLALCEVLGQSPSAGQSKDPLKVAPNAYKMEFENDWVRVMRVHYGPRVKIREHYHTERPAAYVYLSDSGPVIFKHVDLPYGAITRPALKAGTFRLYHAVKEVHAVENTTDVPSDFLRVEFKTQPVNQNSLRGKFPRETVAPGENLRKVQFENEQIVIERLVIAPKKSMDVSTNDSQPALVIALTASAPLTSPEISSIGGKRTDTLGKLDPGKTIWIAQGQQRQFENSSDAAIELLRFGFKTKPFNDPTDRTR
ncbi:MAG TPA: hypothetical protein VKN18_25510 [Blastocatellia bacterium]|nr:hypothetical protein [Blastocatellia bacterium]